MTDVTKLVDLLGSESGNRWIEFMDEIKRDLSNILRQGKPKKEDIEASIIGQSGFESWSEMVNAPTSAGGLGWNIASFNAWRRAYSLIETHSYLRDYEFSASQINTFYNETRPKFPANSAELDAFLALRIDSQENSRLNSLKNAQNRAVELETALKTTQETLKSTIEHSEKSLKALSTVQEESAKRWLAEIQVLNEQREALVVEKLENMQMHQSEILTLKTAIKELESVNKAQLALIEDIEKENRHLNKSRDSLEKSNQRFRSMTLWQKIKSVFQ